MLRLLGAGARAPEARVLAEVGLGAVPHAVVLGGLQGQRGRGGGVAGVRGAHHAGEGERQGREGRQSMVHDAAAAEQGTRALQSEHSRLHTATVLAWLGLTSSMPWMGVKAREEERPLVAPLLP